MIDRSLFFFFFLSLVLFTSYGTSNKIINTPYYLTVEGLRVTDVQNSEILQNALAVALEDVLVDSCECTVEVTEPEITLKTHSVSSDLGAFDQGIVFISSLFSQSHEAEKFEKVTDQIELYFEVQLSSADFRTDDSPRRHAPGFEKTSLYEYTICFIDEARHNGYKGPLDEIKVTGVSTSDIKPKAFPNSSSSTDGKKPKTSKWGIGLAMFIFIMGGICMAHIITDKEIERYKKVPQSILGHINSQIDRGVELNNWSNDTDIEVAREGGDDMRPSSGMRDFKL